MPRFQASRLNGAFKDNYMPTGIYCRQKAKFNAGIFQKGYSPSEEIKEKLSKALRGKKYSARKSPPPFTEEHRRKLSEARKGRKQSEETRRKLSEAHKGKKMSEESKEKNKQAHLGKKASEETKKKMSESQKRIGNRPPAPLWGRIVPEKTRVKIREALIGRPCYLNKGKNHWNWQGGITKLNAQIRNSLKYKIWRREIFERDNFTCQECGQRGGELNVDHKKKFAQILFENKIRTLEEALNCKELWNLDNGGTICKECHLQTDTWGGGKFYNKQFIKPKELIVNLCTGVY